MNQKTLIGLAAAALIAIVVAVAINRANRPQSEGVGEAETQYLVPGLRDHVNDVDKLIVTGAEGKTLATLARGQSGWTVAEKNGYAADTGKLRELLLKLADAKLVEQKTSSKDKYAALGVEDVSAKDAKGVQVEIGGLAQPVKLVVGTPNARGGGTFVRRAGEAESWLASGALSVDKKPEDWLRKDLADVQAARLQSVAITRPDGKTIHAAKAAEGDANFKLADVPKGREPASDYAVNGLASPLANLRFDDVVPSKDAPPGDKPVKARYAAFDGLVVDVVAWEKDGKNYAQLTASLDAGAADQHIAAQQAKAKSDYETQVAASKAEKPADAKSGEGGDAKAAAEPPKPAAVADPAKDREDKLAALNKEVADLNARFKDWTFVLPAYKFASINKSPDDLLKPLEDKKADAKKPALPKSDKKQ